MRKNLQGAKQKDLARLLYTRGVVRNHEELATRIGVSATVIGNWVDKERWDDEMRSLLTIRESQLAQLYRLLERTTTRLKEEDEVGLSPQPRDLDIVVKLTNAIRNLEMETSIAEMVDTFMKFNEFLRNNAPEQISAIIGWQDAFVKSQL